VEKRRFVTIDGNEATAHVAFLCNEVLAIYPITPSSPMGELPDAWAAKGRKNIFGAVPDITEMQSEAGAAGAVHGALQAGALTSTFTASQGLLLMIPNMFKIAGELTAAVFHVSARTVATHCLSIFGDHSDVMACRSTGWAMLCSNSVQEAQDMAMIAQSATLKARVPFVHFFDGFRTSHEVNKIEQLTEEDVKSMIDPALVQAHRDRAMNPNKPVLRGTAQNPDVFFQAREACNPFYNAVPALVQRTMDEFAKLTGRQYHLFDYVGAPDAERVVILMGSGVGAVEEIVEQLTAKGEKVGVLKVRLFRSFDCDAMVAALPKTVKSIAVLDRTKEPGCIGEPLYQDVVTALVERWGSRGSIPTVIGGRYGLSSKEFTPAMAASVFAELASDSPRVKFTVGINDDVTNLSLDWDATLSTEASDTTRAVFYGLGSDGTVGANKNSCKIVGENTDLYAQGYFVYDSRKAGSVTTSHLRFSPRPLNGAYLIDRANFVACHQSHFPERLDMLSIADEGATFLLNSSYGPDEVWDHLPRDMQQQIIDKKLKFFVIDAYLVAREAEMGVRINTVMQTCFFKLANILPEEEAIAQIKNAIKKTYGKRGETVLNRNYAAVDGALSKLHEVTVPEAVTSTHDRLPPVPDGAPKFVSDVLGVMIADQGDSLPVSAMPVDGTFPTGTTKYEKRSIAQDIPIWDKDVCIQCGLCSLVCPHAAIRMKAYDPAALSNVPEGFEMIACRGKDYPGWNATIQVAPDDCTGCGVCVDVCPAKNKKVEGRKAINMEPKLDHLDRERVNFEFFLNEIPNVPRDKVKAESIKGSQLLEPLFEFSGACAGCGETPYVKLITQFFGDRMMIANATGCSSIYGGNLPCTPYTTNDKGHGPTWSNSLFEDNAEFGLGMRLAVDQQVQYAHVLLKKLASQIGDTLVQELIGAKQSNDTELTEQRERLAELKQRLAKINDPDAVNLLAISDMLIRRSIWSFGGDGWAYDIGFGGVEHVFSTGRDINILVLDTEIYSNTGGQASKATPRGAVAKFAAGGKPGIKKDLRVSAMAYGNVFVGQIALGANPLHTIKTIRAAEAYPGVSLIIAYSPCIGQGINLTTMIAHQKEAVTCGYWPLYHYDPREAFQEGSHPFHLDSKAPKGTFKDFAMQEGRFSMLARSQPEESARLLDLGQQDIMHRWEYYEQLAGVSRTVTKDTESSSDE